MTRREPWRIGVVLVLVLGGCNTVSPGTLQEIIVRDDPPEEVAAGTLLYGGGLALVVNRLCESPNLESSDVLCQKASVLRLDEAGSLRWTYTVLGPVRITSVVEVSPGQLVLGGVRKVGPAPPSGFVEAIKEGQKLWTHDLSLDSAVRAVEAGLEGVVWVAGRSGTLGVFETLDPENGDMKGQWILEDPSDPPEYRIVESVVTAMIPAPDRGVYAAGTVLRVGGSRDVWVAKMKTTYLPEQSDMFNKHLGSPGFGDDPGAFVLVGGGLLLAVRDVNPDLDQVKFYLWNPDSIGSGPETILTLDKAKYRWVHGVSDGMGGALLAGSWRPAADGAFEPRILRVTASGTPDPAWRMETEVGIRVRTEEGRGVFIVAGSGANPMIGGWFLEQGKAVGFLTRVD